MTPPSVCVSLTQPVRYDQETQHAFVGDYSGQITLLKLERQTYSIITTLKGHQGEPHPRPTRSWLLLLPLTPQEESQSLL